MDPSPVIRLQLELGGFPDGLTGCVTREGAAPMQFTGWIGFNAVIEAMWSAAHEGGDAAAVTTGGPR
jgi:hypothetical protein